MRHSPVPLLSLILAGGALAQTPVNHVFNHRACDPEGSPRTAPVVAVGCQVLDPDLGCVADSPVTLLLNLQAPAALRVKVLLSNAPPQLLNQLVVTGKAKLHESTLIVAPGSSAITGFSGASIPIPLLRPSVVLPPQSSGGLDGAATTRVRFVISQFVGATRVADASVNDVYRGCSRARTAGDTIVQSQFSSSRNAVALIHGRRSTGCGTPWSEVHTGAATIFLGNLLKNEGCFSSAATFSQDHAVAFKPGLTSWTNDAIDKLPMPAGARVLERVKLWLLYDPCVAGEFPCTALQRAAVKKWPETNLATAALILKQQFGGIDFENLGKTDLTEIEDAERSALVQAAWIPAGCGGSSASPNSPTPTQLTLNALTAATGAIAPNQLNVFYVLDPGGGGVWCAANDPDGRGINTILIASHHDPRELAHEIGHALLNFGGHVEGLPGFTNDMIRRNLMNSQNLGDALTIGQLFRANVDTGSAVNRHGRRPGASTLPCDNPTPGSSCPKLSLDVMPRP